jgi:hypothetical protein
VGGEAQPDPVPAVDEDVGVMPRSLGGVRDAVDEGDRLGEVPEVPVVDDLVALAAPARCVAEVPLDRLVAQRFDAGSLGRELAPCGWAARSVRPRR